MNKTSIARINAKNQQTPSWIDDPFELKGAVKGVTKMSHEQALAEYIQELVGMYAKFRSDEYTLWVDMLPCHVQNELVRLYLEATGRDTGECVYGSDFSIDNKYTCALLAMLQNDCTETRQNFAKITRKNLITYYTNKLDDLLSTACVVHLHSMNNSNGLYASIDYNNGDYVWSTR